MGYIYLFLGLLIITMVIFIVFKYIFKPYRERYKKAMADIEEAFLDAIRATDIILSVHDKHIRDEVIHDSIRKNVIVERIFKENDVFCTKENKRSWIFDRVREIRKKYDLE